MLATHHVYSGSQLSRVNRLPATTGGSIEMTAAEEPKLIKQRLTDNHPAAKKVIAQELINRNLNNTQILPNRSVEVKQPFRRNHVRASTSMCTTA